MTSAAQTREVPSGVLLLLRRATGAGLLDSVDAMSAALMQAGWVRDTGSGSWSCDADASWTVESADHAPNLSIFANGDHEHLLHLASALHALLDSGQVGALRPGQPDPDWSTWSGGDVVFTLYLMPPRRVGNHRIPGLLQLALTRADTPPEGLPPDPQRARRLAREGSAITRWYLAGEDHLPDDVVALLAADEDAAVVAALDANEERRQRIARGEL